MTKKLGWLTRVVMTFALGLAFAGASFAQTSATINARKFEVISVDGNQLVFSDERGTNTLTVPDGFRFTVDGKQLAIGDLKPGMKGTAIVTTTTTVTPVTITVIKKGVVVATGPASLTVKDEADGVRKRFTQDQLNDRGIKIIKEGKVTHVGDVQKGDEITATIVSQGPPVVVTEQEVQASLAQAAPAPAATTTAAAPATPAEPAASAAPAMTEPASASAMAPAASAEMAAPPPTMAAAPASAPAESSGLGTTGWIIIVLLIAVAIYFFSRRKKPQ